MKKKKKLTIEEGRASRLKKSPPAGEVFSGETVGLLSNLWVINKEAEDRTKQTRKKISKLNWLIRNIPKEGPSAREIFMDRRK